MSWVSDITGGIGDAVSSLVSGVESMFSGGSDPSSSGPGYTGADLVESWSPTASDKTDPVPLGTTNDNFVNPLKVQDSKPASAPAGSVGSSPIYQGALATGALRLLGGALAPNPMAMQINAQDTWTQQAIARAKQNQNVDKVVIPHVASATPRKGLIGTNIG